MAHDSSAHSIRKILFIGGGNMASAIIKGMVASGYNPSAIYVVDRNLSKRNDLSSMYGVNVASCIGDVSAGIDILFLSIKPQVAEEACMEIKSYWQDSKMVQSTPLIVSVMAGITSASIAAWLGDNVSIVRAMPNTPSAVGAGVTGVFANQYVSLDDRKSTEAIFTTIGLVTWLEQEDDINTIIALSGSGPAYYFYFMEIMRDVAVQMGLTSKVASELAIQTAYGAALLAKSSHDDLSQLRQKVTSKGGTTEAALNVFKDANTADIFAQAMARAASRACELSKSYGV